MSPQKGTEKMHDSVEAKAEEGHDRHNPGEYDFNSDHKQKLPSIEKKHSVVDGPFDKQPSL